MGDAWVFWLGQLRDNVAAVDGQTTALVDHFTDAGNVTTGETDLYSDTIAAKQLSANGDKLDAHYCGTIIYHATATRRLKVYFAGTLIYDSTALTLGATVTFWELHVKIIRLSSSALRTVVHASGSSLTTIPQVTGFSGVTLTDPQILKITAQAAGAGAATNDIVAKFGSVRFHKAA